MAIRILSKPTRKNEMRMRLTFVDRCRKRGTFRAFCTPFLLAVVYYYSMMVYTSPSPFHNCPPLVLRTLSNLCNCGCHFTGTDVSCVNRKKWTPKGNEKLQNLHKIRIDLFFGSSYWQKTIVPNIVELGGLKRWVQGDGLILHEWWRIVPHFLKADPSLKECINFQF